MIAVNIACVMICMEQKNATNQRRNSMKSRLLLITGTIMALAFAVGCSNDRPITAPASVDNTLSLPNDDAVIRFSAELTFSGPQPTGGPLVSKVGIYHMTARGCQTINVKNDMEIDPEGFIELTFPLGSPLNISSGSLILVKGTYLQHPGAYCMLPSSIEVEELYVLASPRTPEVEETNQF